MVQMELLRTRSNQEFDVLEIASDSSPVLNGKHCGSDGKWRRCRAQFFSGTGTLQIQFKRQGLLTLRGKLGNGRIIKTELFPNGFAIIYMRDSGHGHCNHSMAVLPLQTDYASQVAILSSQSVSEIKCLGQKLQDFCNVATYKVDVKNSIAFSGPAFLHILQDSIILSELNELKFVCFGQWPIHDCNQFEQCDNGLLFTTDEGSVYLIHTSQSSEICTEFLKRLCILKTRILKCKPNGVLTNNAARNLLTPEDVPPIPGRVSRNSLSSDNVCPVSQHCEESPPVPERCPLMPIQRDIHCSSSSDYRENESNDIILPTSCEETCKLPERPPKRPPKPQSIIENKASSSSASEIYKRTHHFVSPSNNTFYKNRRHHSDSEMQQYDSVIVSKITTKHRRSFPGIDVIDKKPVSEAIQTKSPSNGDDSLNLYQNSTAADNTKVKSRCYVYTNLQNTQQQYENVFIEVNSISYVNWSPKLLQQVPERPPPVVPPRKPCPPIPPRGSKPRNPERCQVKTSQEHKEVPDIYVAVFASQPVAGRTWFLRVAFIHKDDTTWKTFQELEEGSNHELKKIQVLDVKEDIQVALEMPSEFELTSETCVRDIDLESVKSLEKGKGFVIEFCVLDKITDRAHEFFGKITVGPKDNKSCCLLTNRIEMGINQVFERKQDREFLLPQPTATLNQCSTSQSKLPLSYTQRMHLCQKLDVTTNPLGHDWRLVASKLNFTNDEIIHLEDASYKCNTFSPMKYVLITWEQRDPTCSVSRLISVLNEVGRPDIVQDITNLS